MTLENLLKINLITKKQEKILTVNVVSGMNLYIIYYVVHPRFYYI